MRPRDGDVHEGNVSNPLAHRPPAQGGRSGESKGEAGLRPLQSPAPSGFVFIQYKPGAQPSPRKVAELGD